MSRVDEILGNREDHPSYGMLSFSRVTSNSATPLFGSSIKHKDTIRLRLKAGHKRRTLNSDWYYGDKLLYEVEMSYSQFAELITSMNIGDGIPVTIRATEKDYDVPDCPFEDKGTIHKEEFQKHLDWAYSDSKELINKVEEIFESKKSFNKTEKQEILSILRQISYNIGVNQSFMLKQFQEQMEQTVTESKGEIESFFQNKMYQLAQSAFVEDPDKMLGVEKCPVDLIEEVKEK